MKRFLLLIGAVLFISGAAIAQTTLSAGDIVISAYNEDGDDDFYFVLLTDIESGTEIIFTDKGWLPEAGSFREGTEGEVTWTATSALSKGTEISILDPGGSPTTNYGTVSETDNSFTLASSSGDQIIAFQGTLASPTPIYMFDSSTSGLETLDSEVTANQDSGLPTGLTEGTNAYVRGSASQDNFQYNCPTISDASASNILASFMNSSNYTASTSTTYSAVGCNYRDATISGNEGWRLLSFPIENPTIAIISDDSPVQGIPGGDNATATDANFYQNLGAADANQGTGYTEPATVSTVLDEGLGFAMYFFDNATAGSTALPDTLDVSGSEPSGTVQVTISELYTLVGNPFASNMSLSELAGNDTGQGLQDGLTGTAQLYDDNSGNFTGVNYGTGVLAPWQGFFVERNSALTTTLNFPQSAKTTGATTNEEFAKIASSIRQIELLMEAPEGFGDSGRLYFTESSTDGYDAYDSKKFASLSGAPSFAFILNEDLLFQDSRYNGLTEITTYRIDFSDAGVSGTYKFTWPVMDNIPSDWSVKMKDLITGKELDLRVDDTYEFEVSAKQKRANLSILKGFNVKQKTAKGVERFEITITPNSTSVTTEPASGVTGFALDQNYPNPFNPSTTINYSVENSGAVTLSVYNLMGQKVAELVNETKSAGSYNVTWNASQAASGMYYYRLEAGGQVLTRKMTLIK